MGFFPPETIVEGENMPLEEWQVWVLLYELSSALAYLHHGLSVHIVEQDCQVQFERIWNRVLHRDIKPSNIVFQSCEDGTAVAKLCDLGIATVDEKNEQRNRTTLIGTKVFYPPEISLEMNWTIKGDIYTLAESIKRTYKLTPQILGNELKAFLSNSTEIPPSTEKALLRAMQKRWSSLVIIEKAHKVLSEAKIMEKLPRHLRNQIIATEHLLGKGTGGYLSEAFREVVKFADDLLLFNDRAALEQRQNIVERLCLLHYDGAKLKSINKDYNSAVHVAVLLADMKLLERLLKSGADPDVAWAKSGWTPLHLAAQTLTTQAIEIFVKHKVHSTAKNPEQIQLQMIDMLLDHNAKRTVCDKHGHRPEHYATSRAVIERLKPIPATIAIRNNASSDRSMQINNNYYGFKAGSLIGTHNVFSFN
ncbi:hypothetical protein T440DRAFT_28163 [Plenodomus tracheiphilus IPT5]|uniref:Protein kinase domain-containing protein n=1 Tax=Plenodomus tracheiphilus IPT5 TaxID=1408161 RepID=A0A6A7BAR0_9PLEO|nr:hypothetical protein T440DRAFT_28163 [Plenodomus tracheiphilus IPT5]